MPRTFIPHHYSKFAFRGPDLVGRRFGKLVVLERHGCDKQNCVRWRCLCDCGKECFPIRYSLIAGLSRSCGCGRLAAIVRNGRWGGASMRLLSEYNSWRTMLSRCYSQTDFGFARYGGRGITVCRRWRNSFIAFVTDMGKRPAGMSLDRKNNDGNYCRSNCRWATRRQQAYNRSTNRILIFRGSSRCIAEWARLTGITPAGIVGRLRRGLPIDKVLCRISSRKQDPA